MLLKKFNRLWLIKTMALDVQIPIVSPLLTLKKIPGEILACDFHHKL